MKKTNWILSLTLVSALASLGWAQAPAPSRPAGTQSKEPAAKSSKGAAASPEQAGQPSGASVRAGTRISAQLVTNLDARAAKPGDEVAARVTKDVKQNGRVVIRKGDRLLGHVTSAQASSNSQQGSQVDVAFDRLAEGSAVTELNTVVSAVLSTPSQMAEPMTAPEPVAAPSMGSRPAAQSGGAQGGLLGGVGSTVGAVGSTVGSTVGAAGSAVQGAGSAVGANTQTSAGANSQASAVTPLKAIHLKSEAQAEHQGQFSSALSTQKGNLRLDSGTRLEFRVAGQTETGKPSQ